MITINLAPEVPRGPSENQILVIPAAILTLVCGIGYLLPSFYADYIKSQADEVRQQTEAKKAQLEALQVDLRKAEQLKKDIERIEQKKAKIAELAFGRKQHVAMLDLLQQVHLEKMWFDSLVYEKEKIMVHGIATNHDVISEYVRRLKQANQQLSSDTLDSRDFNPSLTTAESSEEEDSREALNDMSVVPFRFKDIVIRNTQGTKIKTFDFEEFSLSFKVEQTSMK